MAMGNSYRETDEVRKLLRAVGKALPLSRIRTPHQPAIEACGSEPRNADGGEAQLKLRQPNNLEPRVSNVISTSIISYTGL